MLSPTNQPNPTAAAPGAAGAPGAGGTTSQDYSAQYAQYYGGQDPYAAYGGYQNYVAYCKFATFKYLAVDNALLMVMQTITICNNRGKVAKHRVLRVKVLLVLRRHHQTRHLHHRLRQDLPR